jgi:hypothetical protein
MGRATALALGPPPADTRHTYPRRSKSTVHPPKVYSPKRLEGEFSEVHIQHPAWPQSYRIPSRALSGMSRDALVRLR